MPVHIEVNGWVTRAALDRMNKLRAPFPSVAGLRTSPKPVENGFGEAGAEGARRVDVQIRHLPPVVHRDGLMPNAPDERCFLLGSLGFPGINLVDNGIAWEGATPFGATQINLEVGVADPVSSLLRGVLLKRDPSWPVVARWVKVQVENWSVEE